MELWNSSSQVSCLTLGSPPVIFCRLVCKPLFFISRKQASGFSSVVDLQGYKFQNFGRLPTWRKQINQWCVDAWDRCCRKDHANEKIIREGFQKDSIDHPKTLIKHMCTLLSTTLYTMFHRRIQKLPTLVTKIPKCRRLDQGFPIQNAEPIQVH